MALNDAALVTGANAIYAEITHVQLHSAASADGTTNLLGGRVAKTTTGAGVDADGDITIIGTWTSGLTAGATVHSMSYWTAATGGALRGINVRTTGDATVNAAGAFTYTATENSTAA